MPKRKSGTNTKSKTSAKSGTGMKANADNQELDASLGDTDSEAPCTYADNDTRGEAGGLLVCDGETGRFDLEQRTFAFAQQVRAFVRTLPQHAANQEDVRQLVRASGSVGANYIEANEALGRKDFIMHIRICRKEAKECGFWLRLLDTASHAQLETCRAALVQEARELTSIFGAIYRKCTPTGDHR